MPPPVKAEEVRLIIDAIIVTTMAELYQTWPTGEAGQVLDLLDFDEETAEQNPPDMSHKSQIVEF